MAPDMMLKAKPLKKKKHSHESHVFGRIMHSHKLVTEP